MFIAAGATGSAKLQRSGMASRWRPRRWRAVGCQMPFRAAPNLNAFRISSEGIVMSANA